MVKICPDCGTEQDESYKFCNNCGASLDEEAHKVEISEENTEEVKVEDAIVLDTTNMSFDEVVNHVIKLVEERV